MKAIYYILFLFTTIGFSQSDALFDKANTLYNEGDYEQAIATYNQLLTTKMHASEVYFNKANAHYKLHQLAPSIYNYEKALQLNSNNEDAKVNLVFANNQKIDKIDTIPTTGFSKMVNTFINAFHFDVWSKIAIAFMCLFVFAIIGYLYSVYTIKKRLYFTVAAASLLVAIVALSFAYQQENNVKHAIYAIVFSKETQVKTAPKLSSEQAFILHEGTKVKVLENFKNWTKIKLTNGSIGWVIAKDIKNL